MNISVWFLLIAVLSVGILIFVSVLLTQKRGHVFNTDKYQSDWLKIENSLEKDNPATYNMAVVEADKLLDKALREMGTAGNNMGERLKRSSGKFTQLNAVWHAHKLRNQIAHEHGFNVEYLQAKRALNSFRQSLKDLGAI